MVVVTYIVLVVALHILLYKIFFAKTCLSNVFHIIAKLASLTKIMLNICNLMFIII